jgi:hypothetical protein
MLPSLSEHPMYPTSERSESECPPPSPSLTGTGRSNQALLLDRPSASRGASDGGPITTCYKQVIKARQVPANSQQTTFNIEQTTTLQTDPSMGHALLATSPTRYVSQACLLARLQPADLSLLMFIYDISLGSPRGPSSSDSGRSFSSPRDCN